MIKTEIKEKNREETYPMLKRTKNEKGELIVLFTEKETGIVVSSSVPSIKIGDSDSGWNESKFKVFDGEVTLRNN